jgi:hypothetical protein
MGKALQSKPDRHKKQQKNTESGVDKRERRGRREGVIFF